MQRFLPLIKRASAVLVLVAILCSLFLGFERIGVEQEYKNLNLSVNEADVRSLANGQGMTNEEMLEVIKDHGVSQLLFKESTVASLENAGQVVIAQGRDVQDLPMAASLPSDLPINEANCYIVVTDNTWREKVLTALPLKIAGATAYDGGEDSLGVVVVPTSIEATQANQEKAALKFTAIGVGFDDTWMQTCADKGFDLIAQVSSWKNITDESLAYMADEIKSVPNLALLMFNDKDIVAYPETEDIETFYQLLLDEDGEFVAPLGQIEFNPQTGFGTLTNLTDKNVVRLHTISNEEMSKFEGTTHDEMVKGIQSAVDRLDLAANERNMRCLLLRFFAIDEPAERYDTNIAYLDAVTEALENDGFNLGADYQNMGSIQGGSALRLLVGLGICAGFLLLMLELGFPRFGLLASIGGFALFVVLYLLKPILAMQLMALLSVIEFPILSCIRFLPPKENQRFLGAVKILVSMMAVSFIGAILMIGMLSDKAFMLKLSSFIGIKVAHIIPILVVPFVIYILRADKPLATTKALLNKVLDYKWVIIFGVVGMALMIYVSRTGNDGAQVSDLEMTSRQFLTDYMGVRPRNKEFLIGYPATILYLMYGAKRPSLWVLTIPLVIGQISLVNTYAHIHTPLLVSLHRSFNGLILGVVFAFLAVVAVQLGTKLFKWLVKKIEASEAQ